MKHDFNSPETDRKEILKDVKTSKRNRTAGIVFVIIGFILLTLGIVIVFVKGHSIVVFISLPLIFLGLVILSNSKKDTSINE